MREILFKAKRMFQYITCYSLSPYQRSSLSFIIVSIHHMLLFILLLIPFLSILLMFQYITCYSLSDSARMRLFVRLVSIHHMLLFIRRAIPCASYRSMFQYITCYSLSVQSYWSKLDRKRFNTSHVTLYPGRQTRVLFSCSFQYITCYSLSSFSINFDVRSIVSIHHMLLFIRARIVIYISLLCVSIHHMLLFIFHSICK